MLKHVFSPCKIRDLEIRNRLVVPAMVTNYCNADGTPTEKYFSYHETKAKGGWGLIITEDYAVEARGKGFARVPGLWEDNQVELHAELPRRVHNYGGIIFAQIYHAGRQTKSSIAGAVPVAPSSIPCPTSTETPRMLNISEIRELVSKFGDTAFRARQAGFDGIEIHGAHGYLVAQFMSAYSNKRTDSYGGSLNNRLRFPLEIISEIRAKAGNDYPIIFRISGEELVPGGRTIEETKTVAMILEEAGVDAIHVSAGVYGSRYAIVPPYRLPHAWIANYAAKVRKVVSIPVITVGWINNPFIAEALLVAEEADFIAMGRASLADPDMPNKAAGNKFEDIIHCIGCLQGCVGKIRKQEDAGCMLNPQTGREAEYNITPVKNKKKVFIAGGGVAGATAAITASRKGHEVVLYEKKETLGGRFALAAIAPGKGEFSGFIEWQNRQLIKNGVRVELGCELTLELVKAEKPDVVIVATGGCPISPDFLLKSDVPTVTADEVLLNIAVPGDMVVVVGAGLVGAETAHYLASLNKNVILMEMTSQIAKDMEPTARNLFLQDLGESSVQIITDVEVTQINDEGVFFNCEGQERSIKSVDTVVVACGLESNNQLFEALSNETSCIIIKVGDAATPRKALEAIEEGFKAALEIG